MSLTPSRKEELLARARGQLRSKRKELSVSRDSLDALDQELEKLKLQNNDVGVLLDALNTAAKLHSSDVLSQVREKSIDSLETLLATSQTEIVAASSRQKELVGKVADVSQQIASSERQLAEESFIQRYYTWLTVAERADLATTEKSLALSEEVQRAVALAQAEVETVEAKVSHHNQAVQSKEADIARCTASQKAASGRIGAAAAKLQTVGPELEGLVADTVALRTSVVASMRERATKEHQLSKLKVQRSQVKMDIGAVESEITATKRRLEEMERQREHLEASQQKALDRKLYRRLQREVTALERTLTETPTFEELQERETQLQRQVESLATELASANEEMFLLEDDQLVGRCGDLQSLLETTQSITVPALEERLQQLREERQTERVGARHWAEEKERHLTLLERCKAEESMLDRSIESLRTQQAHLIDGTAGWDREIVHWDEQREEWSRMLFDLEQAALSAEREQEFHELEGDHITSSHDDSGFAPEMTPEIIHGPGGHDRLLRRKKLLVRPPQRFISMPMVRKPDVSIGQIASTLFRGLTFFLRPRASQKRQQHTLTI